MQEDFVLFYERWSSSYISLPVAAKVCLLLLLDLSSRRDGSRWARVARGRVDDGNGPGSLS